MPDRLDFEKGISPDTLALLKARGHNVDEAKPQVLARVEGILVDGGWITGGTDLRASGKAAGW